MDCRRLANSLLFKRSTYFVSVFLLFSESCSGAADGRGPISVQRLIFIEQKILSVRCRYGEATRDALLTCSASSTVHNESVVLSDNYYIIVL